MMTVKRCVLLNQFLWPGMEITAISRLRIGDEKEHYLVLCPQPSLSQCHEGLFGIGVVVCNQSGV